MRAGGYKSLWLVCAWALAVPGARAGVASPDIGLLQEQNRVKKDSEEKIQRDVLDPILGKGNAVVFVDVEMELKLEKEESTRSGMGLVEKYHEKQGMQAKGGLQTTYVLPGIPKPKTITAQQGPPERPESAQAQQAQQVKGIQEERFSIKPVFKKLGVTVIHDELVLKTTAQVDLVRARIVDAMSQYSLAPDQVSFRPTVFHREGDKRWVWTDDLKHPEVYIPLLFALLALLLLMFLFGPLARFFRQYVAALREKPAAEVDIDTKIESPDGKGGESPLDQEGRLDITMQQKPPEPPPPPPEEDEAMKKFEPFAYINEDNIKRLVYLFILRKEEPWVIATVLSYLRPDYARMVLTSLPVDMQAKLALEALTVRQVTREQVQAIDADVKENVDFVVGGMERLTAMLNEADTATRNNILGYLKNEKPLIFDKVRKHLMLFEDVVDFPDREMQTVVRELKTEAMARALQGAPPEIINKFLTNMSAGAAALLKESMEYAKDLAPAQIDEERAKIMEVVKVLEKEGKIMVRERAEEGIDLVEGMQEELSAMQRRQERFSAARRKADESAPAKAAPAAEPAVSDAAAQAQSYFSAGVSYFGSGQAEASIPYFEYALSLDPSLASAHQYLGNVFYQLGRTAEALRHFEALLSLNPDPQVRAWVESLKSQVGG
ncbi:MAG: FliG C-terminal domain-containing protein [Elusimicrobia bacterium]|nr:FliG C-terminal domain-containing protein [Elusimicrobiota bacterium]